VFANPRRLDLPAAFACNLRPCDCPLVLRYRPHGRLLLGARSDRSSAAPTDFRISPIRTSVRFRPAAASAPLATRHSAGSTRCSATSRAPSQAPAERSAGSMSCATSPSSNAASIASTSPPIPISRAPLLPPNRSRTGGSRWRIMVRNQESSCASAERPLTIRGSGKNKSRIR
jgi:hypothetical protein